MSFYHANRRSVRAISSFSGWITGILLFIVLASTSVIADVIDTSFDAHLDTTTFSMKWISKVLALPDGKTVVWGWFNKYNGRNVGSMIRVNPDGSLDNSFDTDLFQTTIEGDDTPKLLPDGKIIVCGSFTLNDGTAHVYRLVRVNTDGTLDTSFSFEPTGEAALTRVDASGRVLVWGSLQYVRNGQTISRRV